MKLPNEKAQLSIHNYLLNIFFYIRKNFTKIVDVGIRQLGLKIDVPNLLNERNANVEIRDKREQNGKPAGTVVILTFKEY